MKYVQCFVQCLGWYENSTEVFLVMEYLAHGDLQSVVEHTAVPEDAARVITRQLVEGIAFMHDNDFVHRDLKLAVRAPVVPQFSPSNSLAHPHLRSC